MNDSKVTKTTLRGERYTITMKNEEVTSNKVHSLRGEEKPEQRLAALISPSQLPRMQRPRFVLILILIIISPSRQKRMLGPSVSFSFNNITQVALIKAILNKTNNREAAASPGSSLASLNSLGLPSTKTTWDQVGPHGVQWDADSVGLPTPRPSPRPCAHPCALPQVSVSALTQKISKRIANLKVLVCRISISNYGDVSSVL